MPPDDRGNEDSWLCLSGHARARESGSILGGWCSIADGEGEPQTLSTTIAFDLELPDGTKVLIEPLEGTIVKRIAPESTARGDWRDLENSPLGRVVESRAPGPLVHVKLRGAVISDGDPIFVIGRALEETFDEQSGNARTAATSRASIVKPEVIGVGSHAERAARKALAEIFPAQKKPKITPKTDDTMILAHWVWLGLASAAILVGVMLLRDSSLNPITIGLALGAVTSAIVLRPGHILIPKFLSMRTKSLTMSESPVGVLSTIWVVLGVATLIVVAVVGGDRAPIRLHYISLAFATLGLLIPLIMLMITAVGGRRNARCTASLLAPPAPASQERGWTVIQGQIADDTPIRSEAGTYSAMVRDSDPGTSVDQKFEGSFFLETTDGSIEVRPDGAVWASTFREKNKRNQRHQAVVPVGFLGLVAGRLDRKERMMAASGPESLVVFATYPNSDPRAELNAFRAQYSGTLNMLVLTVLCAGAVFGAVAFRKRVAFINPVPIPAPTTYALSTTSDPFIEICDLPDHRWVLPSVDDEVATLTDYDVLFPVRYFGATAPTPFTVCTNGWLSLERETSHSLHGRIPNHSAPNATIAPYWDDINTRVNGICIATVGAAPNRMLVVEWRDMYHCCHESNGDHMTFEVIIHEALNGMNNVIDIRYDKLTGSLHGAAAGLEDTYGDTGTPDPGPYTSPRSVRYTPEP